MKTIVPEKGRGVFATNTVKKGTLIWTSHKHYSARFPDAGMYRQFLRALPPDLACDVLLWSYVEDLGSPKSPQLIITTDLNDGALMNTQWYDTDPEDNTGYVLEWSNTHPGNWKQNLFALRDIEVGEELLLYYGDFATAEGWEEFGL